MEISFNFYQIVWHQNTAPKMNICLLRAIHNKLLTRDKLIFIGSIDSDICPLCLLAQKSRDHLFFSCPYAAYIWSLCKLKLELDGIIGSFLEECTLIRKKFKGKHKVTMLARLILREVIWHIWKERTARAFQ